MADRDHTPVGARFSKWLVLSEVFIGNGESRVRCRCDCGIERDVLCRSLVRSSKSCGCRHIDPDASAKKCSTCGETKTRGQYSPHSQSRDGLQSRCRPCCAARHIARYRADPEKARQRQNDYYYANKSAVLASNARSRDKHAERVRATKKSAYERDKHKPGFKERIRATARLNIKEKAAYDRAYRLQNRERMNARAAKWRAANPLKRRAISHSYTARRRSRKAQGDTTAAVTKWTKNAQKTCFWCGRKRLRKYHVDHFVPLARGGKHEIRNLVIACGPCNIRKNSLMPGRFCVQPRPGTAYDFRPTHVIRRSVLRRTKPNETYRFAF